MNLKSGHGLDSNGYIVSDVSIEKIAPIYMPCIQDCVESLNRIFQEQLHSVYVYGSVARGDAVVRKSDLDLIALFNVQLSSDKLAQLKKLAQNLTEKYRSLVSDVGIAVADYDYTFDPSNYYEIAFIKEISVCVYGEDVGAEFGPYKLTSEIAISFNGDICESFHRTLKRLETASDIEFITYTKAFTRKLIRTYYSMVMARSQIWSTQLHEQSKIFIHYFPEKELVIRTLLKWLNNVPTNREEVYELFKKEGKWACENFVPEANITAELLKKNQ